MAKRAYVFDCEGKDVPPVFIVHANCFEIAQREAVHRFERYFPNGRIDASRAKVDRDDKYFYS